MANYANLKATINANIKANGTEAITGPVLNSVLTAAVNTLGAGYQFMGVATTSTSPGTPDANVFYIASAPGTYTNFKNSSNVALTVADGEVAILKYNGSWTKEVTGAATAAQVTQLGQEVSQNTSDIVNIQQEIDAIHPIIIEGDVTNAPDEEDLTTDENDLLKFANRSTALNQMGYKILRKDATFTAQVTDANTIYEIRYPFDLDGEEVTIPAGCVLKFVGGQLSNGTLTGNGTRVCGDTYHIFADTISISGLWDIRDISTDMFTDLSGDNTLRKVFALSNAGVVNVITIKKYDYDYVITLSSEAESGIEVKSNTTIIINGDITLTPNAFATYMMFNLYNAKNISILGDGTLTGDKTSHLGTSGEFGHCVRVMACSDISIRGIKLEEAWGDGLSLGYSEGIVVENVSTKNTRRLGISVVRCHRTQILNCSIDGVSGTDPQSGIDVEPNTGEQGYCVSIENCIIKNCAKFGITGSGDGTRDTMGILISNCRLIDNGYGIGFHGNKNLTIQNCLISCSGAACSMSNYQNVDIRNCNISGNAADMSSTIYGTLMNCKINLSGHLTMEGGSWTISSNDIVCDAFLNYTSLLNLNFVNNKFTGMIRARFNNSVIANNVITYLTTFSTYAQVFIVLGNSTLNKITDNIVIISQSTTSNVFHITGEADIERNKILINENVDGNLFYVVGSAKIFDNEYVVASGKTLGSELRFYTQDARDKSITPANVVGFGSSSSRPNYRAISDPLYQPNTGKIFFDTTLGKPIIWNGTAWVNMDGTALS